MASQVIDLRKHKTMPEPTPIAAQQAEVRKASKRSKVEVLMRASDVAKYAQVSPSTVTRWKQGWTGEPLKFEGPGRTQTVDLEYFKEWHKRNSGRSMDPSKGVKA
ncbi:hypothetical protein [Lacticaseibacillus absianus]|uniref:hypothetical protein n=1 Tax=Lacticaseibacillus absianus TaxID=2729623 RepID=UPI0015CDA801|nr:hypothetical protein [Lacticaseibacillus absianus]